MKLGLINSSGKLKLPVIAYRSTGSEFILYIQDLNNKKDIFANRLCILNAPPSRRIKEYLQKAIEYNGMNNHVVVKVSV